MTIERLDALCVRESNGKSHFTRIGVAFPAKQGDGWSILLDAMPASVDGQYKIILREPLPPRDSQSIAGVYSGSAQQQAGPFRDLDDDVPF